MRDIQITKSQAHGQHHWPFDIISSVFSFVRLIDLGRLLRQTSGDRNFWDYCSYAIQTRAKAEAWELTLYTPARYVAALCHGNRNLEAIGRLRCTGYDTQKKFLHFESVPAEEDHFFINTQDPPSSLKLICAQWPYPPTAEDQTDNIPVICSPGIYQQQLGVDGEGGQIQYSIVKHYEQQWADTFCNQCHTLHQAYNNHHHNNNNNNTSSYGNSESDRSVMKIKFLSALVTFEWLQQGLQ